MFEAKEDRAERAAEVARKFKEEGKAAKAKPAKKAKVGPKTNVAVVEAPKKLSAEQIEKKLGPLANEINVRFEKIAKLDGQADDHRLAAALRLEEAKQFCAANGVPMAAAADPEVDPAVLEGPAGELIRLGLIDPADVPADIPSEDLSDVAVEGPADGSAAAREVNP